MSDLQMETERLILRPPKRDDAPRIVELADNYEVAKSLLTLPHPYTLRDADEFIERITQTMEENKDYVFAITLKESNLLIGIIGIHPRFEHQRAELGYWVGMDYWNKGYVTEAAHRMLEFAFSILNLNRVHAAYFVHNPASARVMQKLGMQYEGLMRQHFVRFGELIDAGYYAILRSEWEK